MSRDVERQLLPALLAFQNNFIDRAALLAAFDAWAQDRSQSLVSRLVAQGAISNERRQLLDGLVDVFVARFGGDVEQSLAHVSQLNSSLREELRTRADPDVQASLAVVGRDADPYATVAQSVGENTSEGTRFRILRPHARGGLGEVFVAADGELPREVALKQIQARHADDPDSRGRFVQEAEITGALEHPNIVPVYGLGTYADGRPFYAMRFIRGDSLQEAAARYHDPTRKLSASDRSLEFRKLLQRFIDVCNAIAYAHSRGVLHRDLKPGNIMLGKYGETLVVDWGLAKAGGARSIAPGAHEPEASAYGSPHRPILPSGSGSNPTQYGTALGTPAYMSPEQAAGRLDELGPTSDVYGLGATLYYLLTGKPPLEGNDLGEILRRCTQGDVPPPRTVRPDVPKPLAAICKKAMALNPADRYPSARALADDVEHWLADEAVAAHPEGVASRAGRWMRKHRALVLSGVATLAGAAIVAGSTAYKINQARRLAESAQRAETVSRHRAEKELDRARFYLETFLSLKRFGRDLAAQPLRKDFSLETALIRDYGNVRVEVPRGVVSRGVIARNMYEAKATYSLSMSANIPCYWAVFYAFPPGTNLGEHNASELLKKTGFTLVYPSTSDNAEIRNEHRESSTVCSLAGLHPTMSDEVAYFYVIASDQPFAELETIGKLSLPVLLPGFKRDMKVPESQLVKEMVVNSLQQPQTSSTPRRVAEEIVVFYVRKSTSATTTSIPVADVKPVVELHVQRAQDRNGFKILTELDEPLHDGDKFQIRARWGGHPFAYAFWVDSEGIMTPLDGQIIGGTQGCELRSPGVSVDEQHQWWVMSGRMGYEGLLVVFSEQQVEASELLDFANQASKFEVGGKVSALGFSDDLLLAVERRFPDYLTYVVEHRGNP